MNNCTFCSIETKILFSHITHEIGNLCLQCYLQLHGTCSVCSVSLLPVEVKPDVTYNLQAKFIGMGEKKTILVCDSCNDAIRKEFPLLFR